MTQPWPWYASGLAISAIMLLLIFFGKSFGFSSNLRNICSMMGAGKRVKFFDFDWKAQRWNLLFLVGAVIGGFISKQWLGSGSPLALSEATIADLKSLDIPFDGEMVPSAIFNWQYLFTFKGMFIFLGGGFLIGFGTRYAGGCTSGHAISGLSNMQLPSLIAVVGFFIGGLVMTHLIFPLLFS
ncbi:YeeE/YedE family protein [Pedobacter psychroterrae]|uniref:YeeE/YedE family protein n=1 Tax=Pedobacter psychroterrae TaxID=2530453 RepID=A0A4R0NM09_9SPHI|nr:YeeE/YedE thiosulfate transporter family protein [Pedobacter psychroterrae]TCD00948.1 YeeE/YedE family protein [Pedobacter psychroterrae]